MPAGVCCGAEAEDGNAAMSVSRELDLKDFAPWLGELAARAAKDDGVRLLKAVALMLEGASKDCFDQARGPDGSPWPPIRPRPRTPAMGKADPKKGEKDRPLRDTGILAASMTAFAPHHIEEVSPTTLVWGTSVDYALPLNDGATINVPERHRGKGEKPFAIPDADGNILFRRRIRAHVVKIPPRPFVGISDQLAIDIVEFLAEERGRSMLG